MAASDLTVERARSLFAYDPETGLLTNRVRRSQSLAGNLAGHVSKRFQDGITVRVDYSLYGAHRLIWLIVTGAMPSGQVDHLDGDTLNNRWGNLRDVCQRVNLENKHRARSDSSTGIVGVMPNKKGWMARISANGKPHYLGTFKTKDEARAAYVKAKRELHEGCTI